MQARTCAFATSNNTIKLDSKVIGAYHPLPMVGKGEEVPKSFTFDGVASPHVTQEAFFERVGRPMAEYCLSGYNGCIFAYGQTGSGKTYTIQGPEGAHRAEDKGLTVRVLEHIFRKLSRAQRASPNFHYICEVSYLELYQEELQDLLSDESKKMELREDLKKGVYVENMTKIAVQSAEDAEGLYLCGAKKRHVASSKANSVSSRSHAIFTIYIQVQEINESGITAIKSSMLHIVDLAGSERQKNTEATGKMLQEAGNINKSLTHLGKTIRALVSKSENKRVHVPYRESKLTFLLKQSLGGNSKTSIIATVDPGLKSYSETLSTLRFADRAKMIRNNAVINESSAGTVAQLQGQIQKLQLELQGLRVQQTNASLALAASSAPISPRNANPTPIEIERDERVCELEELLRAMIDKAQKANVERDNFSLKVMDLQRLLIAQQSFAESFKLIARLREDKLRRVEQARNDLELASALDVSEEEITALKTEIDALKFQRDHHPDVLALTVENLELKEILEQYETIYGPDGEIQQLRTLCSKFSSQIVKLSTDKAKLIALLKGEDGGRNSSSGSAFSSSGNDASGTVHSKLDLWEHEVNVETLEAEIARIKIEARQQLATSEERELAIRDELENTQQELLKLQDRFAKVMETHEEEKTAMEAHYSSLSETVRDKYEMELKILYERLEKAHVSSVTVLSMEKQLSEQMDEYVSMKKIHFEMQNDLKALCRVLEASYRTNEEGYELDEELDLNESSRHSFTLQDALNSQNGEFPQFNLKLGLDSGAGVHDTPTTPRKVPAALFPQVTPSKSPWTPNRPTGKVSLMTPQSRSGLTPGRPALSIPRLAIAKIQEMHAIVSDYTSKISELEITLGEKDGVHLAECAQYETRIESLEDQLEALEKNLADVQSREALAHEEVESLGTQLNVNGQLVEEKESENVELREQLRSLQEQVSRLSGEKDALSVQSTTLLAQIRQQKDEQVLAMMNRQDEVERELMKTKEEFENQTLAFESLQVAFSEASGRLSTTSDALDQTRALVDSLTSTCSEKDEKLKQTKRELGDCQAECESLLSRLSMSEAMEEDLQALKQENDELKSAVKETCRGLRERQNQLSRLEEAREREALVLEQEKQVAAHAFEALQQENDQLAAQLNQVHAQLRKTQGEAAQWKGECDRAQTALTREQTLLADAKEQLASLEGAVRAAHVQQAQSNDAQVRLEESVEHLTSQNEKLALELEERTADLQAKSQQLFAIMNDGTMEEHLLRDERDTLLLKLAKRKAQLSETRVQLEHASAEHFHLQEQLAEREAELETKLKEKDSKLSLLAHTAEVKRRQHEEADGKNIHEIGQLRRQLKEATMRRELEAEEHQQMVTQLNGVIAELQVDKVLKSKDAQIMHLELELHEAVEEIKRLAAQLDDAQQSVQMTSSALNSTKSQYADWASHKNGKIKVVQVMKSEIQSLQKQVTDLTNKLAEANGTIAHPTSALLSHKPALTHSAAASSLTKSDTAVLAPSAAKRETSVAAASAPSVAAAASSSNNTLAVPTASSSARSNVVASTHATAAHAAPPARPATNRLKAPSQTELVDVTNKSRRITPTDEKPVAPLARIASKRTNSRTE
jgi:kinesin family protein 15